MFISKTNFQFGENIENNGCLPILILSRTELLVQEVHDMMIILHPERKKELNIKKLYC